MLRFTLLMWTFNLTLRVVVCAAIAGSTILMSCQDGSGCVRGQDQQTRLIILPLHALMSYCICGHSTAPAVTMTTRCHWHPPVPAMAHASTRFTPTGMYKNRHPQTQEQVKCSVLPERSSHWSRLSVLSVSLSAEHVIIVIVCGFFKPLSL